jgi:hypothetical protein
LPGVQLACAPLPDALQASAPSMRVALLSCARSCGAHRLHGPRFGGLLFCEQLATSDSSR